MADTEDLVQESLLEGIRRIDHFESRHEGAFLAYLRQILVNKLRAELRRPRSQNYHENHENLDSVKALPLLDDLDREAFLDYEKALSQLKSKAREAIILRFEFGLSFGEMAAVMGKASADAARMSVNRALRHLAAAMTQKKADG